MSNTFLNHVDNSQAVYEPLRYYAAYPLSFSFHSQYTVEMQSPSVTPSGQLWQQTLTYLMNDALIPSLQYKPTLTENRYHAEQPQKNEALIQLLRSWREDDEQEQRDTWEYLKQALDEDRLSDRKLFP